MATKQLARNNHVQASAITWDASDVLDTPNGIHDAIPLLADKTTGRLLVDIGSSVALDNLNVNTDQIEGKQDVTNALLATTAADVATTKGYALVTKGSGVVDSNTQRVTLATDGPGVSNLTTIASNTAKVPGFSLPAYDYISCSYTGSNLTGVVYKTGGSSGTSVATLTLAYDGSNNLTSVTKS
jgi:hypothetical protein